MTCVITFLASTYILKPNAPIVENDINAECAWIGEIYDGYSATLYAILLDLCESEAAAEEVLIKTFERLCIEKYFLRKESVGLVHLVKMAVDIAKNQLFLKTSPCIKSFQQSPMLHSFLFNDASLESICRHSGLTRVEIARQVRAELTQPVAASV